jgi:hypothetical protein
MSSKGGVEAGKDLEDLSRLKLTADEQAELLDKQTECSVIFCGKDGWPRGVIMSFMFADGCFWLTAVDGRIQTVAIENDPRVSIMVSGKGTDLVGRQMFSVRGKASVLRDDATKAYFFPRFAQRLAPSDPESFIKLLDSESRVIFKVEVVSITASHDSRKMPGDGRGGPARK